MKHERKIYRCSMCGNIITKLTDSGAPVSCCGKEMELLTANTTDAATEKHVPAVTRDGNAIAVQVGSVPHPMTEEHHIAWIVVAQGAKTEYVVLEHTGEPKASFVIDAGDATVYEYCNLHGLWAVDVD